MVVSVIHYSKVWPFLEYSVKPINLILQFYPKNRKIWVYFEMNIKGTLQKFLGQIGKSSFLTSPNHSILAKTFMSKAVVFQFWLMCSNFKVHLKEHGRTISRISIFNQGLLYIWNEHSKIASELYFCFRV